MEVQSAAGGGVDLLMFCDEEEQEEERDEEEEERDEEEEEGRDEALDAAEEEMDLSPVRTLPIPVHPVGSCSLPPHLNTLKPSGPLGFKLNGRWLTRGGAAELKLSAHPRGSASGFTTTVQILEPAVRTPTCSAEADPTPIITDVVSGEAALSVLRSSPPASSPWTLASPWTLTSPWTLASPQTPEPPRPPSSRPPHKVKGQLGPVSPPDCLVCRSQFKLVSELRGFMCLCSPVIAQSLKSLKKKKKKKRKKPFRSRDQKKNSSQLSRSPGPPARTLGPSEDFLPDRFPSPDPPPSPSGPQPDRAPAPPHGKLVIMVEDFYYGRDAEPSVRTAEPDRRFTGPYRCFHCGDSLGNNLQLMSHMKQHSSSVSDCLDLQCLHCFRHFLSAFKLQSHIEAVHSQDQSTAKCKICELEFVNEAAFLLHMKTTHKPGEMPYVCQVCNFRSSFYSDVWFHFQQFHSDSKFFLCQYCLRVIRSNTCYQQHFTKHQKKKKKQQLVFGCEKCRLQFLCIGERLEHIGNHRTHIRPPQLIGLRPGTKVTVRTYSEVGAREVEDVLKLAKVVDDKPPKREARKRKPVRSLRPLLSVIRKPVRSLGPLLSAISQESVSRPPQRCVECLSSFQDFGKHFPSLVHCSLCRFLTCCSTSYANHMINNHATCRKTSQYLTIFRSDSMLAQSLRCVSCMFTTVRGDVMADHLTERPGHRCIMMTHNELGVDGENQQPSLSVTSSVGQGGGAFIQGGGAFIPIHLLPSGQTVTQLSVKHLVSPPPLSSPPAMTIKFLGPRPQPEQAPPLSAPQLLVVLSSLCHGLPQACRRFLVSRPTVRSWTRQQERRLADRKWAWRTERLAEWVLSQREQQLRLSDAVLLQTARSALGVAAPLQLLYGWTADFLLRHQLGLQPDRRQGRLPRSVTDGSRAFARSLVKEIRTRGVPPHLVGCMDEFSIFIDPDRFSKQNPAALQLEGSPGDRPVFDVVLSALSDGTFLPPLLFFRGAAARVPVGFPDNVLLEARRDGFSDQERLRLWIDQVWRPRVAAQGCRETVLLLDVYRGHMTEDFRSRLSALSTGAAVVPPGCCCRLQPLSICVTPVLRDFLQARWTQLVSAGGLEGLGLDQLALTLACWLSEVSSTLNAKTHLLYRSFSSVCDMQREERGGEEEREEEQRGEEEKMITALMKALLQLPDSSHPPEPVMGEEEEEEEEEEEHPEEVMKEEVEEEEEELPEEVMKNEEEEHPEEVMKNEEEEHPEEVMKKEEEEHPEEVMKNEEEQHPE